MTDAQNLIERISVALDHGDLKAACSIFSSIDDDDVFEVVVEEYPGLMNYDAKGSWIGNVRNENGWTS